MKYSIFHTLSIPLLALALTGCGGGSDKSNSENTDQMNQVAPPDTTNFHSSRKEQLSAVTVPNWTTFPMEISRNKEGIEILTISDPQFGPRQVAIRSRDKQENITALDSKSAFHAVTSFLGNRIGMICGTETYAKSATTDRLRDLSYYLYISGDLVQVDQRELFNRKYRKYYNCEHEGVISLDQNGTAVNLDVPAASKNETFPEAFTPQGRKHGSETSHFVDRAKAYKYEADGKITYIIAGIYGDESPNQNAKTRDQYVYIAISQ